MKISIDILVAGKNDQIILDVVRQAAAKVINLAIDQQIHIVEIEKTKLNHLSFLKTSLINYGYETGEIK